VVSSFLWPKGQTIDLPLITEAVHRVHKDRYGRCILLSSLVWLSFRLLLAHLLFNTFVHTRKSLYKTLFDRENAGKVLTYIITIFFAILMIFVVMLIFELSITQYVSSSSSSPPAPLMYGAYAACLG
jgi:hypothetical protein